MYEKKCQLIVERIMSGKAPKIDKNITKDQGNFAHAFEMETWGWTQGVALYGLYLARDIVEADIDEYLNSWFKKGMMKKPNRTVNTTCPLLTMSLLNKIEYHQYIDEWLQWIKDDFPLTKHNIYAHLFDDQVWVDTVFMTLLFMLKEGINNKDEYLIEEMKYQTLQHINYLYDTKSKLFYHGYSFQNEDNFGAIHWGRGNGWMLYALSIILESLVNMQDSFYYYCKAIFIECCSEMIKHQNANGLWNTIIDQESYDEVSGTSLIASSFIKGYELDLLSIEYYRAASKAVKVVAQNVNSDGTVNNVSAGTSVGSSAKHYKNVIIADMPYGKSLALVLLLTYNQAVK